MEHYDLLASVLIPSHASYYKLDLHVNDVPIGDEEVTYQIE